MAAHWSCSLLSILKYLLIPYRVPVLNISSCSLFSQEDLLGALFSIIQRVSIRIIPCIGRAPNFVKYFPIYDHDFHPHVVIANFRWRNVKIPSALTRTDADPSLMLAASFITLLRLLPKIVVSPFLQTWTPALEIKGHFRKSSSKLVIGPTESLFSLPHPYSLRCTGPKCLGHPGALKQQGRSFPTEQAYSPITPCKGKIRLEVLSQQVAHLECLL